MATLTHSTPTSQLRLLVVGGAWYIGSHLVKHLLRRGCDVVTFDNFSIGHRDAVLGGEFVLGGGWRTGTRSTRWSCSESGLPQTQHNQQLVSHGETILIT